VRGLGIKDRTLIVYTADHGASFLGKGHVYEAGVRVPLIIGGGAGGIGAQRVTAPVALIDLAPTLLAAAGLEVEPDSLHGRSLVPLLTNGLPAATAATSAASSAAAWSSSRPIFIEIGYARAVVRSSWKLVVVNDVIDRCRSPSDGTCRNLHGETIDRYQCNFTANGHMGNRLVGACNMTYDAVARHAGFCDRKQLYHLTEDPLEQHNVVDEHPELYDELLELIIAHAHRVEPSNPAILNRTPGTALRQCDRQGGNKSGGSAKGGGAKGGGAKGGGAKGGGAKGGGAKGMAH